MASIPQPSSAANIHTSDNSSKSFGEHARRLRLAANLTIDDVVHVLGYPFDAAYVAEVEKGKRDPSGAPVAIWAYAVGGDPDEFEALADEWGITIPRADYDRLRAEAEAARTFERHLHAAHERAERCQKLLERIVAVGDRRTLPAIDALEIIVARARRTLEAGDE